eukprot:344226_1
MEIDSVEHLPSSLFKSCTEVGEHLGSNADFWCFELYEDDYTQVFSISLLFLLLSLGYYLLTFGAFIWASTSLKSVKCNIGNRIEDDNGVAMPFTDIVELNWFNDGIASSATLPIYLSMYIIVSLIYFACKIFIVSTESSRYIYTMDDTFSNTDFNHFVNANALLMIGIFLANSAFSFSSFFFFCCLYCFFFVVKSLYLDIGPQATLLSNCLVFCWGIISLVDAIFSCIICCIYYPMILTILYFIAVAFMTLITIVSLCVCMTPCVTCICVQMCCDWLGFLRMYRDARGNREIQCMSPSIRFLYGFTLTVLFITFVYLAQCLAFIYIFGILGGPTESVVFLDFESTKDCVIFWMFVATFTLGFIGFLMGLIFSCCRNRELRNESAEMTNSIIQYHSRRNERQQNEATPVNDPFSDQRGYNLNNGDNAFSNAQITSIHRCHHHDLPSISSEWIHQFITAAKDNSV